MNVRSFSYFLKETFNNLLKNGLMTVASVSVCMISLSILGAFLLIIVNLNNIANELAKRVEIVAYLRDGTDKTTALILKTNFHYIDGVENVEYIPKEEGLKKLEKSLEGQVDLKEVISYNPLPDSLEVKVSEPMKISKVAKEIESFPEVEEVFYGREVLIKLLSITKVVQIAGFVSLVLLGIATLLLIMNTIRLTVFARRKEIKIMQLVGATDWFIRWPFLLEGIFQGFLGAVFSIIILVVSYSYSITHLRVALPFVSLIYDKFLLLNLSLILVVVGVFLGALGSLFAVGKFLVEG